MGVHMLAERAGLEPFYPYSRLATSSSAYNDYLTSRLNVITLSEVEVRQMRQYKKGASQNTADVFSR